MIKVLLTILVFLIAALVSYRRNMDFIIKKKNDEEKSTRAKLTLKERDIAHSVYNRIQSLKKENISLEHHSVMGIDVLFSELAFELIKCSAIRTENEFLIDNYDSHIREYDNLVKKMSNDFVDEIFNKIQDKSISEQNLLFIEYFVFDWVKHFEIHLQNFYQSENYGKR